MCALLQWMRKMKEAGSPCRKSRRRPLSSAKSESRCKVCYPRAKGGEIAAARRQKRALQPGGKGIVTCFGKMMPALQGRREFAQARRDCLYPEPGQGPAKAAEEHHESFASKSSRLRELFFNYARDNTLVRNRHLAMGGAKAPAARKFFDKFYRNMRLLRRYQESASFPPQQSPFCKKPAQ